MFTEIGRFEYELIRFRIIVRIKRPAAVLIFWSPTARRPDGKAAAEAKACAQERSKQEVRKPFMRGVIEKRATLT